MQRTLTWRIAREPRSIDAHKTLSTPLWPQGHAETNASERTESGTMTPSKNWASLNNNLKVFPFFNTDIIRKTSPLYRIHNGIHADECIRPDRVRHHDTEQKLTIAKQLSEIISLLLHWYNKKNFAIVLYSQQRFHFTHYILMYTVCMYRAMYSCV
jgi:hypothetical protein